MKKHRILVAESDFLFIDKLKEDTEIGKLQIDFVEKGADAQRLMKDNVGMYIGIFISPNVSQPSGISCIKFAHRYQLSVPIFLIDDINHPLDEDLDEESLGVAATMAKPFTIKDILKKLSNSIAFFDEADALSVGSNKDKVDSEVSVLDDAFCPIKSRTFVSGSKSLFDVYVQLRKDKYIKILQSGDQFDYSRLLTYLKKGVEFFYIRNEAREHYMQFCDKISEVLVKKKSIPINKKFPHLFNQCDVTIKTLSSLGVSNENISYAQRYLTRLAGALDELKKDKSFIENLLKDMEFSQHNSGVVLIASMIAKEMNMGTTKSLELLGIACMFHDIGYIFDSKGKARSVKYNSEALVKERLNSNKCFGAEKTLLTETLANHANDAYYYLTNEAQFAPVICQIIKNHHAQEEKAKNIYKGGPVHPMSEILEIADKFEQIISSLKGREIDPLYLNDTIQKISNIFPQRIREPFLKVFTVEK